MKMSENNISNVLSGVSKSCQGSFQGVLTVEVVMSEEIPVLLVAYAVIDQHFPVPVHYQQTAHGPITKIIFICRINLGP